MTVSVEMFGLVLAGLLLGFAAFAGLTALGLFVAAMMGQGGRR